MVYIIRMRSYSFNLKSITVEPVMFLYMFALSLFNVTFQALVYDKVCGEYYNSTICSNLQNKTYKDEEDVVQKNTSTWLLYTNLAMGLPSVFTVVLFLGPWGDRVDRKIPVISPLVGGLLVSISNMINSIYMEAPLEYLLIGQLLNGLNGGLIAALMSMYSYIVHVSTPAYRTIKIGILEGIVQLSGTLGAATSGVILDRTSYVFMFSLITGIMMAALIYTVFWLDSNPVGESMEANGENKKRCTSLFVDSLKEVFMCMYRSRRNENFGHLALSMVIIFILMIVTVGEMDIILIYTRHRPFEWSQTTLGLYKGLESFLRGIAVLTILPVLKRKFEARDTVLMIVGLFSKIASLLVLGLGRSTAVLFIGAISGTLQGFSPAAIRSLTSGMVSRNQLAKWFSLIGMFDNVAVLLATSLFNTVYSATIDFYSGFCFLMAAALSALCICLGWFLHLRLSKHTTGRYDTIENNTVHGVVGEQYIQSDNELSL